MLKQTWITGNDQGIYRKAKGRWGFPGGWDRKEFCLQCRRPGFDPCVRKIPCRSEQLPTPVSLPRESQGQRSLAGYSPQGHRGRHDWVTKRTHTQKEDEPGPDSTEATREGKPAVWLNSCCNLGHGVDSSCSQCNWGNDNLTRNNQRVK